MAINFLNTVDLNFNQLNKAAIQNIPTTDPVAGVLGQLIYNVTATSLKVCTTAQVPGVSNAVFTAVGAGVTSISTAVGGDSTGTPLTALNLVTGAVTITSRAYAGGDNVGHVPTGGDNLKFLRGDGVFATPAGGGTMSSWELSGDTGTTRTVDDGDIVNIIGAANGGIKTSVDVAAVDQRLLIKLEIAELVVAAPASGDFLAFQDITASGATKKTTIANILALAGAVTAVEASAEEDELGIKVTNSTGPIPKVGLDIVGLQDLAGPSTTDSLVLYDLSTTKNKKVTVANLLAAGAVTSIGAGTFTTVGGTASVPIVNVTAEDDADGVITASSLMQRSAAGLAFAETPASGSSDKTLATTAFVQSKLTGLLEFKGGFNATTGALDDGSGDDLYTDVVTAVGDYYVVTTAGDFFGNASTPLTVGDSVIAQKAVPDPGTTAPVEADFVVVQSDTDLATLTTVGIGNVEGTASQIGVTYSSGTGKITNLDRGSSQNIFKTITAPIGGDVVADSNSDTLNFTVSGGMTITNTPGTDTVNFSSVNNNTEYTAGTGLTLSAGDEFSANVNATAQTVAANGVSATAGRTYALQVDASDNLVVNVPHLDGVQSVVESTTANLLGINVSTTSGVATVGLDIDSLASLTTLSEDDKLVIFTESDNTNREISIETFLDKSGARQGAKVLLSTATTGVTQQTGQPAGTVGWVIDVSAVIPGASSGLEIGVEINTLAGETVMPSVTRTNTTVVVNFLTPGVTIAQGDYVALLKRVQF